MLNILNDKPSIVIEAEKARFRPGLILQILIFIAVFIVSQLAQILPIIIFGIIKAISDAVSGRLDIQNPSSMNDGYISELMDNTILISLFCTVIAIILTVIYCRFIEKRSLYSMGFVRNKAVSDYLKGLFVGTAMFGAGVLIAWLSGTLDFKGVVIGNSLGLIIVYLFGFILQGMSEEVLLRGYFMISMAARKSIISAILINSVLFSLIHLLNSGITLLSIINLILFGIFASVYVLRNNSIWGICAIHSAWNFTQGNLFGILVSGQKVNASILSFRPTEGNTLINGGMFGLEGGLAVTIVLAVSIAITVFRKKKQ